MSKYRGGKIILSKTVNLLKREKRTSSVLLTEECTFASEVSSGKKKKKNS